MIRVTAFKWVPPFARGLVRDLRVRWALEEAGLAYETRRIGFEDQPTAAYRALQPFGQVPVLEEDGLVLFESGAIVLHLAQRSEALAPADAAGRAQVSAWVLAALNTLEPAIQALSEIDLFHAEEAWAKARRPGAEAFVRTRLAELSVFLGEREHLVCGRFTAADLMTTTVLQILRHTDLVAQVPNLAAYVRRHEARPAYQAALAAQSADFDEEPAAA